MVTGSCKCDETFWVLPWW